MVAVLRRRGARPVIALVAALLGTVGLSLAMLPSFAQTTTPPSSQGTTVPGSSR
jgi:hypothetical protein